MIILKNNFKQNLEETVIKHAKFQKVLLIFDENVSNIDIFEIYEGVRENCIFNKMRINNIDEKEINSGYKVLIFFCSANSFLNINFDRSDFVNIFIPTDSKILPFFLDNNNNLKNENNYLFLKTNEIDINIIFSVYFNKFYNYLKDLIYRQESDITFDFNLKEITQLKTLELLDEKKFISNYCESNKINSCDIEFMDIKFLKKFNLDYNLLPIADFLLLQAFLLIVNSTRESKLSLVDVYKSMKEEYEYIDKYYSLANNKVFLELINLNFWCLKNILNSSVEKLNELLPSININLESGFNVIIDKLKNFCKDDNSLLNYLYLYNIFGE